VAGNNNYGMGGQCAAVMVRNAKFSNKWWPSRTIQSGAAWSVRQVTSPPMATRQARNGAQVGALATTA